MACGECDTVGYFVVVIVVPDRNSIRTDIDVNIDMEVSPSAEITFFTAFRWWFLEHVIDDRHTRNIDSHAALGDHHVLLPLSTKIIIDRVDRHTFVVCASRLAEAGSHSRRSSSIGRGRDVGDDGVAGWLAGGFQ